MRFFKYLLFQSNTLASTSTNVSSALSTIFAGDYLRCDKSETSSISSVTKRYRLSEYHYSKLAESQSLQKCTTEAISENRDGNENYQKIIRRCLSAPDVKLLNCENCQGQLISIIFSLLRDKVSIMFFQLAGFSTAWYYSSHYLIKHQSLLILF